MIHILTPQQIARRQVILHLIIAHSHYIISAYNFQRACPGSFSHEYCIERHEQHVISLKQELKLLEDPCR